MENLLGHGETRTKEGRERGQEWIMKRFCRIEVREPGSVLVIRLPIQNEVRSLQNYRRYVLESIAQGILVLGKDVTYCGQLGWIPPVVLGEGAAGAEEPEPSSPQCTGRNAAEKRRIFERLQLFRGPMGWAVCPGSLINVRLASRTTCSGHPDRQCLPDHQGVAGDWPGAGRAGGKGPPVSKT